MDIFFTHPNGIYEVLLNSRISSYHCTKNPNWSCVISYNINIELLQNRKEVFDFAVKDEFRKSK